MVERWALRRLIDGVESGWASHEAEKTSDNPAWSSDRDAVAVAKEACASYDRGGVRGVEEDRDSLERSRLMELLEDAVGPEAAQDALGAVEEWLSESAGTHPQP